MPKKIKPITKSVKKKKAKTTTTKSKPLAKDQKRKTIFKTMPNPFAKSFVVIDLSKVGTAEGIRYLKFNGAGTDILTSNVTESDLFPTMEAAQIAINDAFIMAAAPVSQMQIVAARTLLKPHYSFNFVDGQFMLSVSPKPVDADDAVSFSQARSKVLASLKSAERSAMLHHKAFRKTWG